MRGFSPRPAWTTPEEAIQTMFRTLTLAVAFVLFGFNTVSAHAQTPSPTAAGPRIIQGITVTGDDFDDPIRVTIKLDSPEFGNIPTKGIENMSVVVDSALIGPDLDQSLMTSNRIKSSYYWSGSSLRYMGGLGYVPEDHTISGKLLPGNYILRVVWGDNVVYYGKILTVHPVKIYPNGEIVLKWVSISQPVKEPEVSLKFMIILIVIIVLFAVFYFSIVQKR